MSFVQLSSLDDILNRSQNLYRLATSGPDEPEKPVWRAPRAQEPYASVGDALGVDGNEVQLILEHFLNTRSPSVLRAFEKFLFVAKLDASQAIEKYNHSLSEAKSQYRIHESSWERRYSAWKSQDAAHKVRLQEVRDQIQRRWIKLIKSLLTALERSPRSELSYEDQVALQMLERRGLARYKGKETLLEVSAMSVMTTDEIVQLVEDIWRAIEPIHSNP